VHLFEARGSGDGGFRAFHTAFATLLLVFDVASGFAALQLAFRARTCGRFGTRPRARRLFTERCAIGFGCNACGVTLCRRAYGLAFRARVFLAHVFRTTNAAFRLFAVHCAFSTFRLLALHLTFRACTYGVTDSGTRRIIALPATGGVAIGFFAFFCGLLRPLRRSQ